MEEEQAASPVPKAFEIEPQALSFPEAINEILQGKKVTKEEWANENYYGYMDKDELRIKLKDGEHLWIITRGDLEGDDYFVIN